jgi:hypothetical protein
MVGRAVPIAVKSRQDRNTETIIATKDIQKAWVLGAGFEPSTAVDELALSGGVLLVAICEREMPRRIDELYPTPTDRRRKRLIMFGRASVEARVSSFAAARPSLIQ